MRKRGFSAVALISGAFAIWALLPSHDAPGLAQSRQAVLEMTSGQGVGEQLSADPVALPHQQPNIVLIVADDMGWRDIGYNHSEIRTPTLDRLARGGVTLNRFYAQPSCSPTRAALMTGKSPRRLGIVNPLSKKNPTGLPLSERTLAARLRDAGYQTTLTGKWHLGPRDMRYHPNARGFDHFYGNLTGGVGYYDKVHGGGYDWQRNGTTVRDEGYSTHLIAEEAVSVIKGRDPAKPLFLYAAFGAPHLPNEAPSETVEEYGWIKDTNRRLHAAMVTELDTAIGKIHDTLVAEGMADTTLIWFMSDNGGLVPDNPVYHLPNPLFAMAVESLLDVEASPEFVDFVRTNLRDGGSDNRPFSGGKQTVAEGGVRVPAFMHWPGTLAPNTYNHMATVQDVFPTVLDLAGIAGAGAEADGRSLWGPITTGRPAPVKDYVIQSTKVGQATAIYRYPYKLIVEGGARKLYNLALDPLEQNDIAADMAQMVNDLSDRLANFPTGESIALPFQTIVDDPDYFGGEEDREPWADQAAQFSCIQNPTTCPVNE